MIQMEYKEEDLKNPVASMMCEREFEVFFEVPIKRKRPDIICVDRNKTVIGIETKLRKWKDAYWQASINKLWCDESYVAFPIQYSTLFLKNRNYFEQEGIGLISVDLFNEKVNIEIDAKQSSWCDKNWKGLLIKSAHDKGQKYE